MNANVGTMLHRWAQQDPARTGIVDSGRDGLALSYGELDRQASAVAAYLLERGLGPGGALEAVQQAREEGLVRFIGVTGHDWPQIAQAVLTGHFDTVLCWYNCALREAEETVIPAAQAHNTGVVIMNASRNEKLLKAPNAPDPVQFYRYVLSNDAVATTIMGLRNVDLFEEVAAGLSERVQITQQEKSELEAYGAERRASGDLK